MVARVGKPDATGRSSGKITGRPGKAMRPPKGEAWWWQTREMLRSDAWRSLGINARRFIDCLIDEHMAHAGLHNGRLIATYAQLEEFGVTRRHIPAAIAQAEAAGVVRVIRGGMRTPSLYELTWFSVNGAPPANLWKRYQSPQQNHPHPGISYRDTPKGVRAAA